MSSEPQLLSLLALETRLCTLGSFCAHKRAMLTFKRPSGKILRRLLRDKEKEARRSKGAKL